MATLIQYPLSLEKRGTSYYVSPFYFIEMRVCYRRFSEDFVISFKISLDYFFSIGDFRILFAVDGVAAVEVKLTYNYLYSIFGICKTTWFRGTQHIFSILKQANRTFLSRLKLRSYLHPYQANVILKPVHWFTDWLASLWEEHWPDMG